jgi:hypothetical protein
MACLKPKAKEVIPCSINRSPAGRRMTYFVRSFAQRPSSGDYRYWLYVEKNSEKGGIKKCGTDVRIMKQKKEFSLAAQVCLA